MSEDDLALEQLKERLSEWKNYKKKNNDNLGQFPTFSQSIINERKFLRELFIDIPRRVLKYEEKE